MRLINTRTLNLKEFIGDAIPPYAILSHTWGDEEVSFRDMTSPQRTAMKGFAKVVGTCHLAVQVGLEYAWVDTCCIDKSSSAELTEAINSMYQWYNSADVCYVLLEDLGPSFRFEDGFSNCRWTQRGWTLQELLAPRWVNFYDNLWNFRGEKNALAETISSTTNIPVAVIRGLRSITSYSVAARMSWAACRQTTRIEDIAYSLLGIFEVNMPLIYGEGTRAFRRLQEEIIKSSNDATIFAWYPDKSTEAMWGIWTSALAPSPAVYEHSADLQPLKGSSPEYSITNRGIRFSMTRHLRSVSCKVLAHPYVEDHYRLALGDNQRTWIGAGIYLNRISGDTFVRDPRSFQLSSERSLFDDPFRASHTTGKDFYILINIDTSVYSLMAGSREGGIHIPRLLSGVPEFCIASTEPLSLWDVGDRIFLSPPFANRSAVVYVVHLFAKEKSVFLLCLNEGFGSECKVLPEGELPQVERMIRRARIRHETLYWDELKEEVPKVASLTDRWTHVAGGWNRSLEPFFIRERLGSVIVFTLKVRTENLEYSQETPSDATTS